MVNKHWFDQGLDGVANFLLSGCLSEHSPCIVSLLDVVVNTNRPFRFFNMWASHTNFNDLVATNWNLYVRGTKQFMLCKKLKHLKRPLKELNYKHFLHISSRATKVNENLERAQLHLHDDPTNVDLWNFVATIRKQTMSLSESERCFYYQQAKCKHLNQSDRDTKFFHDLVKRNKKRNQVVVVCKEDVLPTTSIDEVAKEFITFYECLLGTSDSCEPIDPDIINAGDDFCAAIEKFFVNGSFLKQINHTVIALVPKGQHTQSVGDYRPIVCCNVFYKVITKIMAQGTVIDRITNICRIFLWGERKALVAWKNICLPKSEGGLGFRDIKSWNLALLAKVLWNIHEKWDSLWIRWVDQVYLNGTSVWDWSPAKGDSPLLKRIFEIRDLIVSKEGTTQKAINNPTQWFFDKKSGSSKTYDYFRLRGNPQIWATDVWRHYIPPKHSFILWLGVKGRLQTKDRLHYLDIDTNCAFCGTPIETLDHLFFQCNILRDGSELQEI
ncbi:hypothetical protein DH2020_022650 [Rehmannia glutinosa]|uniref:Reverse transcriptase zinc-binding domain-containing protein n=1 Tax=Rehmannia glutinosa TaxID=99300 RepID=A0ABR0W7P2_REHGL